MDTLEIYETLWNDAVAALRRGEPELDVHLPEKAGDGRRGVTLALRPSPAVRDKVKGLVDRLAAFCPEQYFYRPEEFHVTVLSIISGTDDWREEIRRLAAYRAILRDVLGGQRPFRLAFRGVTASRSGVMTQGFPLDEGLAGIRDALRTAFAREGFAGILDHRYRIRAAHLTCMRFCRPGADWPGLASLLSENRRTDFGEMEVTDLELIWGDWYASANQVRTLAAYRLAA